MRIVVKGQLVDLRRLNNRIMRQEKPSSCWAALLHVSSLFFFCQLFFLFFFPSRVAPYNSSIMT